jgi:hypothetical protein
VAPCGCWSAVSTVWAAGWSAREAFVVQESLCSFSDLGVFCGMVVPIQVKALPDVVSAIDIDALERRVPPWRSHCECCSSTIGSRWKSPVWFVRRSSDDSLVPLPSWRRCLWSLWSLSTGGCSVVLWVWLSDFRNGGLPHGERSRNIFFLGSMAIGCNSSSRVTLPSPDGTVPSNLGERAGGLFGDGRVVPCCCLSVFEADEGLLFRWCGAILLRFPSSTLISVCFGIWRPWRLQDACLVSSCWL